MFIYISKDNGSTPEDIVKETITEYLAGNYSHGLTKEQGQEIEAIINAPEQYNLPAVEFHFEDQQQQVKYYLFREITFSPISTAGENDQYVRLILFIRYFEYNKEEARNNNYMKLENIYDGTLHFLLEPTERNGWRIVDVSSDFNKHRQWGSIKQEYSPLFLS